MLSYLVIGVTYGFAAAAQPGQFQAFLMSRTVATGWRRTLPVAAAPILSDAPIIALVLVVLAQVPPLFVHTLRVAGGLFLLYLAWGALRARHRAPPDQPVALQATPQRTVLEAAFVNLLNPNPYLAWALVMGPLLVTAWRETPANAVALLAAFYGTLVLGNAGIVLMFAGMRALGPRVARMLVGLSAVALAGFGVYQLGTGVVALLWLR